MNENSRVTIHMVASLDGFIARKDGSVGRAPWPQSQIWVAAAPTSAATRRTIGFDASISAIRRSAAGPVGGAAGWSVMSWGGVQSASARPRGVTQTWRYSTPGWNRMPSRPPPSSASRAATMAAACSLEMWPALKSRMVGGVVESSTVTRLQR